MNIINDSNDHNVMISPPPPLPLINTNIQIDIKRIH